MRNDDRVREQERRKILVQLVNKEFPDHDISILTLERAAAMGESDTTWRIRIEKPSKPRSPAVVLRPSEPLMTDMGINFQSVFSQGIELAQQILANPPLKDRNFQGTVYLDNKGAWFEQRET